MGKIKTEDLNMVNCKGISHHIGTSYSCDPMNEILNVIFSEPATIVFWNDGTKTVVKTSPHDKFDKEKGILWAYYLKYAGVTKTQAQKIIAKHCEEE